MSYTLSDVIGMIRARVGETTEAFFLESVSELIAWINDGVNEQHKLVLQKWAAAGDGIPGHPYLQYYTSNVSTATTSGTSDYAVPSDYSRMIQVNYGGYKALNVQLIQDYAVKNYPQYQPTVEEPKWAFVDDTNIRLYVLPGSVTIPISTVSWDMTYIRKPTRLAGTPGTVSVDCPEEYINPVVDYASAKCLEKNRDDASPLWVSFKNGVESIA